MGTKNKYKMFRHLNRDTRTHLSQKYYPFKCTSIVIEQFRLPNANENPFKRNTLENSNNVYLVKNFQIHEP